MTLPKSTRRQFVQLTGAIALALRHGMLPAQSATDARATPKSAGTSSRDSARTSVASLEDRAIRLEWNRDLNIRVSKLSGGQAITMTAWSPGDYLLQTDGSHLANFAYRHHSRRNVDGAHGAGTTLTVSGVSQGVEKTISATLYADHPGFAVIRVAYRNESPYALYLGGWTVSDLLVRDSSGEPASVREPRFWCYSGASYENRRDWIQPIERNFGQDNYLGMEASDYGGGTPIVDVWHRGGGIAVGHIETAPKLVSLPLAEQHGAVRMAVCSRVKQPLEIQGTFETLETFVTVHDGDHFATLTRYREIMSQRGLKPAQPNPACYEPIWCAWGYERDCTTALIEATLPKVRDLGLKWAVIDDGWQSMIGDWKPHPEKYPRGVLDVRALTATIRAANLKPRLWFSPLSVAPGSDFLHEHADMLLLDKNGAVQNISWWNSFYLCPAYEGTVRHTEALVKTFIGDWGFAGLKIDGQHLNGVAPCFNPAHHHSRPEESSEGLQDFFRAMYTAAMQADPNAVMELCPCGTAYSAFNFPYMNQAPASDPESSWQVRLKGKSLKALMGPSAAFSGDHVELTDSHDDFASTVGVGGIVSTKFTWPQDPKPKDSFLLTPDKEASWRHWIALYQDKMLASGIYRGELCDLGFDRPESHAVEKAGRLYYAFFAERWRGDVALRGLAPGTYRIRDYVNDRELGTVAGPRHRLSVAFEGHLLLEAIPA